MRFSVRSILILTAMVAIVLVGYIRWERQRNTWVVEEFCAAPQVLKSKDGMVVGDGEPYIFDIYGVMIQRRQESLYLLWINDANPFNLKPGERIMIRDSLWTRTYDDSWDGFYANAEDIVHLNSR